MLHHNPLYDKAKGSNLIKTEKALIYCLFNLQK